jgi:hypothetical protein
VLRGVGDELGVGLLQAPHLALLARDVARLDVVGAELGGGLEEQLADPVGIGAVVVVDEPVHQELELVEPEPVVVEHPLHLAQRAPALHLMLDVGVPEAEAGEADLGGLGAAVGEVVFAPLATGVHVDRSGGGPVGVGQLDGHECSFTLISIFTPLGSSTNSWRMTPGTALGAASMPSRSTRATSAS